MKKKDKFLSLLENKLNFLDTSKKELIISKYNNLIDKRLKNGEKISVIITSFGDLDELVLKETKSNNIINNSTTFLKKYFKKYINIIKDKILKYKKYRIEFNNKDEVESKKIKEKIKSFSKLKRIILIIMKVLLNILLIVLIVSLMWFTIIFVASLFMILDGVKFYSLPILLIFIICFIILLIVIFNKIIMNRKIYFYKTLYSFIAVIVLIGLSIGIVLLQYRSYKVIDKVNSKYTMNKVTESYKLPKDKNKNYYLYFNSWYDTKYIIKYDENLKDEINVEIKYYECFYDLNVVKGNNELYISLSKDIRDLISIYLENMKEKKIYNIKELSRNIVTIQINEEDSKRLIIVD